jgi:hypothetical protein
MVAISGTMSVIAVKPGNIADKTGWIGLMAIRGWRSHPNLARVPVRHFKHTEPEMPESDA